MPFGQAPNFQISGLPTGSANIYGRDVTSPHGSGAGFGYLAGQAGAGGRELAGLNLYDPAVLSQLNQILQPYFNQQLGQFSAQRGGAINQAGQSAGAYAAANNLNPSSYVQTARLNAGEGFNDPMQSLLGGQLSNLLNASVGSQQFKAGNLQAQAGINQGLAGQYQSQDQFNQQMANQPGFWDYLLSGTLGLGGSLLGGGFGTALGTKLFGKP